MARKQRSANRRELVFRKVRLFKVERGVVLKDPAGRAIPLKRVRLEERFYGLVFLLCHISRNGVGKRRRSGIQTLMDVLAMILNGEKRNCTATNIEQKINYRNLALSPSTVHSSRQILRDIHTRQAPQALTSVFEHNKPCLAEFSKQPNLAIISDVNVTAIEDRHSRSIVSAFLDAPVHLIDKDHPKMNDQGWEECSGGEFPARVSNPYLLLGELLEDNKISYNSYRRKVSRDLKIKFGCTDEVFEFSSMEHAEVTATRTRDERNSLADLGISKLPCLSCHLFLDTMTTHGKICPSASCSRIKTTTLQAVIEWFEEKVLDELQLGEHEVLPLTKDEGFTNGYVKTLPRGDIKLHSSSVVYLHYQRDDTHVEVPLYKSVSLDHSSNKLENTQVERSTCGTNLYLYPSKASKTFVNNLRVYQPFRLVHGDLITFGESLVTCVVKFVV